MPTFKNHTDFNVTSLVLYDVNVRGVTYYNRHSDNQYSSDVNSILADKGGLNRKTIDVTFIAVNRFF